MSQKIDEQKDLDYASSPIVKKKYCQSVRHSFDDCGEVSMKSFDDRKHLQRSISIVEDGNIFKSLHEERLNKNKICFKKPTKLRI